MPKRDRNKQSYASILYVLSLAYQLGFLIVVPLAIFLWIGNWVDGKLQTSPFFILVASAIGIAMTIYEVYHFLTPVLYSKQQDGSKPNGS